MSKTVAGLTVLVCLCCLVLPIHGMRTEADGAKKKTADGGDAGTVIKRAYKDAGLKPPTAKDAGYTTGRVSFVNADNSKTFLFQITPPSPTKPVFFTIKQDTDGGADMKALVLAAYTADVIAAVYSEQGGPPLSVSLFDRHPSKSK